MLPQRLSWDMAQTTWAQALNPIISNPTINNLILKNIPLTIGTNVINHKLGRNLQGWHTSRIRAAATIYDSQDTNPTPSLTLILISDADVMIDLVVF